MNLDFLPLPLYVLVYLGLSATMVYFAIRREKKDLKGLAVVYLTIAVGLLLQIAKRVVSDVLLKTDQWNDLFSLLLFGIAIIIVLELTVLAIVYIKKGKCNKNVLIGLLLMWPGVIFFALIMLHVIHK